MIEKISAAFLSSFGRLNNDNLQSIPPAITGKNFGSKCEVKQTVYEQSVAHYTSQAKSWALRGCESTNKTVGRGNSTHFAQRLQKQISGGKSSFHI